MEGRCDGVALNARVKTGVGEKPSSQGTVAIEVTRLDGERQSEAPTGSTHSSSDSARAPAPSTERGRRIYARGLRISDLPALPWAVYGTRIAWFGAGNAAVAMRHDVTCLWPVSRRPTLSWRRLVPP
jgi:hypothetical protein